MFFQFKKGSVFMDPINERFIVIPGDWYDDLESRFQITWKSKKSVSGIIFDPFEAILRVGTYNVNGRKTKFRPVWEGETGTLYISVPVDDGQINYVYPVVITNREKLLFTNCSYSSVKLALKYWLDEEAEENNNLYSKRFLNPKNFQEDIEEGKWFEDGRGLFWKRNGHLMIVKNSTKRKVINLIQFFEKHPASWMDALEN